MLFGDLLVYAHSGGSANDGVLVYRLDYHFDDPNPANHSITPNYVAPATGAGVDGEIPGNATLNDFAS